VADLVLPVVRHHLLMLLVVVAGREIEVVLAQLETEFLGRSFQHAHTFRHHLLANAVTRNDGDAIDAVGGHERFFPFLTLERRLARPSVRCESGAH
jgi:hypothetical protein